MLQECSFRQGVAHVVNKSIHDLSLVQQYHYRLSHAYGQGCSQYLRSTLNEDGTESVRTDPVDESYDDSEYYIVCGKLSKGEFKFQAAVGDEIIRARKIISVSPSLHVKETSSSAPDSLLASRSARFFLYSSAA